MWLPEALRGADRPEWHLYQELKQSPWYVDTMVQQEAASCCLALLETLAAVEIDGVVGGGDEAAQQASQVGKVGRGRWVAKGLGTILVLVEALVEGGLCSAMVEEAAC